MPKAEIREVMYRSIVNAPPISQGDCDGLSVAGKIGEINVQSLTWTDVFSTLEQMNMTINMATTHS